MPDANHALVRRRDAAQATLDRYLGQPFVWGTVDCARVAAFNVRQLGRRAPLSRFGRYTTALGAAKALRAQGFADLGAVLDSLSLPRIPPAAALPGDLISLPGSDSLQALCVVLGNGRVLGFHEDAEGACVLQPSSFDAAWRVNPRG